MTISKARVGDLIRQLEKPFVLNPIARVDHFAVYLYLCQGFVARHRHALQDELFYVCSGLMRVETGWGKETLLPDECVVIPRGLVHMTGSSVATFALNIQATGEPERKNGHGRLMGEAASGTLIKGTYHNLGHELRDPYHAVHLAQADEMSLRAVMCEGITPWHQHAQHDELLWLREGTLEIELRESSLLLDHDELAVIPRNTAHRLAAEERAVAISLIDGRVAPHTHMGLMGDTGLD